MRLPARSLPGVRGRRLGRPLASVVVLLAASLGIGAGSPPAPMPQSASRRSTRAGGRRRGSRSCPAAQRRAAKRRRSRAEYYRRIARERVAPGVAARFLPLYREAERAYGVTWRLIASIHRQETAFSVAPTTYHGLNDFGCCAGPMQFNVTNGPVSTWENYREAFRAGRRPARYPHRTNHHPSIYDDFDAIMAAGSLLRASGAGLSLDGAAWTAAYGYYGHDLFGVTYASQVLGRAAAWERDGFCANCADESLAAEFESPTARRSGAELLAEERKRKRDKKRRERAKARERAAARSADRRDRPDGARTRRDDRRGAALPPTSASAPAAPAPRGSAPEPVPAPAPRRRAADHDARCAAARRAAVLGRAQAAGRLLAARRLRARSPGSAASSSGARSGSRRTPAARRERERAVANPATPASGSGSSPATATPASSATACVSRPSRMGRRTGRG